MWCDRNDIFHSQERIETLPFPNPEGGQLLVVPKTESEDIGFNE
jgi:hypothetical protein